MTTRVLLWSPGFLGEIGGIEALARPMVQALHGNGFEFRVMATNTVLPEERTLSWNGVTVHSLPIYDALARKDLVAYAALRRRVREIEQDFDPHVVHVNHHHPGLVVHCDTMAGRRAAVVYTAHGWGFLTSEGSSHESIIGRLIRGADWLVGCAQSSVDAVCSLIPEMRDRSSLIRNAMPPPALQPAPLPWDPPLLLCIGRLVEQKGFDTAIDAMAMVDASVQLRIAGYGPDAERLAARIEQQRLGDRVHMLGGVAPEAVPALMNEATAVLMPSRGWEGLPMVAVEAALMARPLVASELPGLDEAFVPGQTGVAFPPGDAIALAQAIGYLLGRREEAEAMGQRARQRAMREFGWDAYIEAYGSLYERLARRESRVRSRESLSSR
ncbi:MAG TPA: glycosyltransferase family 4 protein [Candidatus Limnocylindrales bacterium]|nr:glycosyltransferase family 4 protein [Candidatus Limnocylindrales bacterium]